MKTTYKGFQIEVKREKSLGGDYPLYFNIIRLSDNWILDDSFEYSDEKVKDKLKDLKSTVDDYLENPKEYED